MKYIFGFFASLLLFILAIVALVVEALKALAPGINDLMGAQAEVKAPRAGQVRYRGMSTPPRPTPVPTVKDDDPEKKDTFTSD